MKKIILWVVAFALVVGAAVAVFISVSKDESKDLPQPIEDPIFVYANIEQLATKGAFDKFITPENRSLIATMLSSQFGEDIDVEHLKSIITNLDMIGIDTHSPIYGYLSNNLTDCVAVAHLSDRALLDRSIALLLTLLAQSEVYVCEVENGDIRLLTCGGVALAYNDSRIACAFGQSKDSTLDVVKSAITRPESDLTPFGTTDLALMVNAGRLISNAYAYVQNKTDKLNMEFAEGYISEVNYNKEIDKLNSANMLIDSYSAYFNQDASLLLSATFDLGHATLAYSSNGINFGEYAGLCKPTNQTHLSNIDKDSFAAISAGVDGKILAQLVRTLLSGDMLQSVGIKPTNEVNMFVSIACDALSTIDGGVTLALENIDGEIKQRYNYYWDEYTLEPSVKSLKAMLMADVTDTYIISNIAQFAGGFLRKVDATHYTLRLMNYNFSMGQDDNMFHLGVNMAPQTLTSSALDAEWTKDVEGAMGYMAVNVDALMASKFMKSTNKYITSQIMEEYRESYNNATEAISYICISVDNLESAEIVVVFDDKSVNALEQINALLLPTLVREGVKSLY